MAEKTSPQRPETSSLPDWLPEGYEMRELPGAVELREAAELPEGTAARLHGLAVPWESRSEPIWWDWERDVPVVEVFVRGAFGGVLGGDVVALRDHMRSQIIGRTTSRTLMLGETPRGLEYDVDVADTGYGRDLVVSVRRRDVWGSSFAFSLPPRGEERNRAVEVDVADPAVTVMRIKRVAGLDDVSPVTRPAYLGTRVDLRAGGGRAPAWAEILPPAKRRGADVVADALLVEALIALDDLRLTRPPR